MPPPNPTTIVGPPVIHHGIVNASRTSTVALVYLTSSLPTPWPVYLASMGMSLLTALLAIYMSRLAAKLEPVYRLAHNIAMHARRRDPVKPTILCCGPDSPEAGGYGAGWRRVRQGLLHIPLLIHAARTAGTLSLAVRVVRQHGDARRPALSSIGGLILSVVPNMAGNLSRPAYALVGVDVIMLIVCGCIVTFTGASSNTAVGYGDLAAIGGAGGCPLNLPAQQLQASYVGCGLDAVGDYANAFYGGPVGSAESIMMLCLAAVYGLAGLGAVLYVLVELAVACRLLVSFCARGFSYLFSSSNNNNSPITYGPLDTDDADDITLNDFSTGGEANASLGRRHDRNAGEHAVDEDETKERDIAFSVLPISGIVLFTIIMAPFYYAHQTRHRTLSVFDSVGPLVRMGDMSPAALAGISWSDWFHVAAPADRFGFMAAWWREHGRRWDTLLAFL
jgi:hypothetical protein